METATATVTAIDWQQISKALCAPFPVDDVEFRPQGKAEAGKSTTVVCYIDARAVAERLDAVVGAGAWSFDYQPLVIERGQIQIAKSVLTVHGVSKADVGEASNYDPSKGCVSDALKRAAVHWGIGRYLYSVGAMRATLDQYGRIPEAVLTQLRQRLPKPEAKPTPPTLTVVRPIAEQGAEIEAETPPAPAPATRTAKGTSSTPSTPATSNTGGYQPEGDANLVRLLRDIHIENVAAIERFAADAVKAHPRMGKREACYKLLAERKMAQARGKTLAAERQPADTPASLESLPAGRRGDRP